ncbi:MAG: 16S rRNA (cytosine(1402)-N(4))-methyltransferase RsmH [Actinomycetales bacterium]
MSTPRHVPVLLERCVELLAPSLLQDGAVLVDATLGLGGHSEAFLQRFPGLRLLGLDRDPAALRLAAERLAPFGDRVLLVHSVYDEIADIAARLGLAPVAAVLFDLGVSSMQLDEAERGFAYAQDAPLDMRMNPDDELTAAAVVNTYSVAELARVLREYGEERFAQRIAARIVAARARQPLTTTAPLAELVREAVPAATRRTGGHPAKRTFQALRIEVNRELQALEAAIPAALSVLSVGGRIAVMSYQSLEDRIVKRAFAEGARTRAPEGLPVVPDDAQPWLRLLTRGAETPTDIEISDNPRAASARLRAAEKIREAA